MLFNANTGQIMPNTTPWYKSSKTNFGPRLAFTWAPEMFKNKTVFRIGAGYYYGPGQTEDQVQPIDSDRQLHSQRANPLPIDPASGHWPDSQHHDLNLGFQPRAYAPDGTHFREGFSPTRPRSAVAGERRVDGGLRGEPGTQSVPALLDQPDRSA